jgi:hypothetical protein
MMKDAAPTMSPVTDAPQAFGGGKSNRPDLSLVTGANPQTSSVYVEWDYSPANRARNHIRDICRNHPGAVIYLVKLPKALRYKTPRPGSKTKKLKKPGTLDRGKLTEKDCGIDVIKTDMGI